MRRIRTPLAAALIFILGCAVGGGASQFVSPPARAKNVQKWDYFCFEDYRPKNIMAKAKTAGLDGWEMVMAYSHQAVQSVCFKRPL